MRGPTAKDNSHLVLSYGHGSERRSLESEDACFSWKQMPEREETQRLLTNSKWKDWMSAVLKPDCAGDRRHWAVSDGVAPAVATAQNPDLTPGKGIHREPCDKKQLVWFSLSEIPSRPSTGGSYAPKEGSSQRCHLAPPA